MLVLRLVAFPSVELNFVREIGLPVVEERTESYWSNFFIMFFFGKGLEATEAREHVEWVRRETDKPLNDSVASIAKNSVVPSYAGLPCQMH